MEEFYAFAREVGPLMAMGLFVSIGFACFGYATLRTSSARKDNIKAQTEYVEAQTKNLPQQTEASNKTAEAMTQMAAVVDRLGTTQQAMTVAMPTYCRAPLDFKCQYKEPA